MTRPATGWCVVIDIDDTLYLERDYVRSGFRAVSRWLEVNRKRAGFAEAAWEAFEAGVRATTFDLVLPRLGLDPTPELVGTLVEVYRMHAPEIQLLPDARVCLEQLAATPEVTLAALTDGPASSQRAKANALGLAAWASPIVYTAELGPGCGKPDPAGFRHIEVATGVGVARCVYVSDNPRKDFQGPRALGWRTLRIRRPGGLHAELPSPAEVDLELGDMSRVPVLLTEWDGQLSRGD